ncbi:MAG: hypothetical protein MRY21_02335 [Simkaniaceae bacterium]|nr:hypothetical protein [Simkaniaceae bacterium]
MNTSLASRAQMLAAVRHFFAERSVMEVDTPLLAATPPIDTYIDIFETTCGHYLHSSPEYAMKKLLSKGAGDIYQMSHVYRKGELGRLHNPVFTMIEWYRMHLTFDQLIEETIALIELFVGPRKQVRLTHEEALEGHPIGDLHYVWSHHVEPAMDPEALTIVTDFPASEAALAKVVDGKAQRFEIYLGGIELANGYDELTDSSEQLKRLQDANTKNYPIDYELIEALKTLPNCVGVAAGFDRLLMLCEKRSELKQNI